MSPTAQLEQTARDAIRLDEPAALIERFGTLVRESGTPDEQTGGAFIVERLRALGIPVQLHTPELYLSTRRRRSCGSCRTATAVRRQSAVGRPPSRSTPTVRRWSASCATCRRGTPAAPPPVRPAKGGGRGPRASIRSRAGSCSPRVLDAGLGGAFERRGAIAQIYIHPGRTSTKASAPRSGARRPPSRCRASRRCRSSASTIRTARPDRATCSAAGPRVGQDVAARRLDACLLPVAEIRGREDPDEFLLVHGHYDSWYEGIGDNATGDAALLELARVLWALRGRLKRTRADRVVARTFHRPLRGFDVVRGHLRRRDRRALHRPARHRLARLRRRRRPTRK